MGMFDYIRYNQHEYQTKDTPNQLMDNYEIRENGTLWVEKYDTEWIEDPNAFLGGYINQINHIWKQLDNYTGEIRFYRHLDKDYKIWEEISAYFVKGNLKHLEKLSPIDPQDA
jgi:hypothetical protein